MVGVSEDDTIKVKDKKDLKYYDCKIVGLNGDKYKVHYKGWNQRWDEWIPRNSARLQLGSALDDVVTEDLMNDSLESDDVEASGLVNVDGGACTLQQPAGVASGGPSPPLSAEGGDLGYVGGRGACARGMSGVKCKGADGATNVKCGFCRQVLGTGIVSCLRCAKAFHAERVCTGLEESVIKIILNERDGAVGYVCCTCRAEGNVKDKLGGGFNQALEQLIAVVGSLVGEVRGIIQTVNEMKSKSVKNVNYSSVSRAMGVNADRVDESGVLSDVKEIYEREKRKKSIIMRGFSCECVDDAVVKFNHICGLLELGQIELSEVVKIGDTGLFRAKVLNDTNRLKLLMSTKKLKNISGFERVYVQRDMTFRQRSELVERRRSTRVAQVLGGHDTQGNASVRRPSVDGLNVAIPEDCSGRQSVSKTGNSGSSDPRVTGQRPSGGARPKYTGIPHVHKTFR